MSAFAVRQYSPAYQEMLVCANLTAQDENIEPNLFSSTTGINYRSPTTGIRSSTCLRCLKFLSSVVRQAGESSTSLVMFSFLNGVIVGNLHRYLRLFLRTNCLRENIVKYTAPSLAGYLQYPLPNVFLWSWVSPRVQLELWGRWLDIPLDLKVIHPRPLA